MKTVDAPLALVTGGAGFIGSNLVERLLSQPGMRVRVFDNLSRSGVVRNLDWLRSLPGSSRLEIMEGDVRNPKAVREAVRGATEIYHLAAQVAVTTSVEDPGTDFEINACGTVNLLEAARRNGRQPFFLYTSTNKVYGSLESLEVNIDTGRYRPSDSAFRGVSELEPLDFHSPYGCSKGSADQYVRDYARIYDLPTVVFRMSCIAGPRQFGNEDQGWVAHFLYSALAGRPITIYGDGYQVRDVLHVYDLLDAMQAVRGAVAKTRGQVFNLGGGMSRAVSITEMLQKISDITAEAPDIRYSDVRPGDQPLYISDTTKIEQTTGWKPRHSVEQTLKHIHNFWLANSDVIVGHHPLTPTPELMTEEVA